MLRREMSSSLSDDLALLKVDQYLEFYSVAETAVSTFFFFKLLKLMVLADILLCFSQLVFRRFRSQQVMNESLFYRLLSAYKIPMQVKIFLTFQYRYPLKTPIFLQNAKNVS